MLEAPEVLGEALLLLGRLGRVLHRSGSHSPAWAAQGHRKRPGTEPRVPPRPLSRHRCLPCCCQRHLVILEVFSSLRDSSALRWQMKAEEAQQSLSPPCCFLAALELNATNTPVVINPFSQWETLETEGK